MRLISLRVLVDECLPFIKPVWSGCIIKGVIIMGANAVGKAHILLLCWTLIILPLPPRFSVRYSSRSEGPIGIKNTSLRARRSDSVCLYFYFALLERNSGKLGISGQILNGNLHGEGLNNAVLG